MKELPQYNDQTKRILDLERELAAANRKIQRLVEIGDRLAMAAGENPHKGSLVTRWNDEWTEAKEEKAS